MFFMEQKRAAHAYTGINGAVAQNDEALNKKLRTAAMKFPAMVLGCGLMQTLAFYESDTGDAGKQKILELVFGWLASPDSGGMLADHGDGYAASVARETPEQYRLLRAEAVEYGSWLKRAAETHIAEN